MPRDWTRSGGVEYGPEEKLLHQGKWYGVKQSRPMRATDCRNRDHPYFGWFAELPCVGCGRLIPSPWPHVRLCGDCNAAMEDRLAALLRGP